MWLANDDDSSVLEPAVAVVVMNVAGEVRNKNMITVDTHTRMPVQEDTIGVAQFS